MALKDLITKYETQDRNLAELNNDLSLCKDLNKKLLICDEMDNLEYEIDNTRIEIYEENINHFFATLTTYESTLNLTFHFTRNSTEELKIGFNFENDNGFYHKATLDNGSFSFSETIKVARLLENKNYKMALLNHSLSSDIPLSDFIQNTINDFITNYDTHLDSINTTILKNEQSKKYISSTLKSRWDELTEVLNNLDYNNSVSDLLAFHTLPLHIDNFISFAKDKAKDYFPTELNNQLSNSNNIKTKRNKI